MNSLLEMKEIALASGDVIILTREQYEDYLRLLVPGESTTRYMGKLIQVNE